MVETEQKEIRELREKNAVLESAISRMYEWNARLRAERDELAAYKQRAEQARLEKTTLAQSQCAAKERE
jgi:ribosomal protein L13